MSQVKLGWIQGQQTKWSIVEIEDFYNKDKSYILDIKPNYIRFGSHLTDCHGQRIFDGDEVLSSVTCQLYRIQYNKDDFRFHFISDGFDEILDQKDIDNDEIRIVR